MLYLRWRQSTNEQHRLLLFCNLGGHIQKFWIAAHTFLGLLFGEDSKTGQLGGPVKVVSWFTAFVHYLMIVYLLPQERSDQQLIRI